MSSLKIEKKAFLFMTYFYSHIYINTETTNIVPLDFDIFDYFKKTNIKIKFYTIIDVDHPFNNDLIISDQEKVNGYYLYNIDKPLVTYDMYCNLVKLWKKNTKYDLIDFFELYDQKTCIEWCKQDRYGDHCSLGFGVTKTDNCLGLYKLPYPHDVILESIDFGCNNRMECVRYSNFFCEWLKRKMISLEKKIEKKSN
ncbi:hypothetical protein Catovirus_1_259 [Catovirus CTV1]|uniref:Uncharacterized protein n=1 Tax=Catovirus CTV1 TaxID=1977631 RepID=A0A1V0S928_9VIRU|nr:hypothetical protein Catovirus_1_259 [Catovirus CTV1]